MEIQWKLFTDSLWPEDNVQFPFLIYGGLGLSTLHSPFPFCNICSFRTLLLAIARMSHIFPSAWEATHMANSGSFLKSRYRILLTNHPSANHICFPTLHQTPLHYGPTESCAYPGYRIVSPVFTPSPSCQLACNLRAEVFIFLHSINSCAWNNVWYMVV